MRGLFVICLLLLPTSTPWADTLDDLIAGAQREMKFVDKKPSGPGADFLVQAGKQAQFFLIGESHGNVETPALTAALATALKPAGYSLLVVETGPVVAEKMKQLAAQEDGMAAFQAFHQELPFSVPFFFWKEEVAMFLEVRALGFDIWGLDQEFIGSGRFLLGELERLVEDEGARKKIEDWKKQAMVGFQHFAQTGESDMAFVNVIDTTELDAFAASLPAGADQARRIVEEIKGTAIVYQHYQAERYYLNNYDRIRLMKKHLAGYIAAGGGLEATPRAIFKFGSMHMGRGYSPLKQLDLGNAAAELAAARFSDSFHINVLTRTSVDRDGKETDWTADAPHLSRFAGVMKDGAWGVFDLREMRQHFARKSLRETEPELAEMVFRFDCLVLAPRFNDVEPMIPLPF